MDVIRLCRLCLTFSEYHANIFFEKIEDKQLWRLVNSVCELNTFLYDGLPEHICVDCVYTLKKTLSFRNRAIEATSALKLMIQRNKDKWEKSEFDASKSSKATHKAVQVETPQGTEAVVQHDVATPPSTRSTTVNKVPTEVEIDIEEWQIPIEWKREATDIEEYGIETEIHTNRNIDNVDLGSASSKVVSDVGLVADASPKKSKRLRSPGKNSQNESNPPSPGRTRTVKVEPPSYDEIKQGPSSEKDPRQKSLSENQSGAENKAARPFVCQQCGASYVRKHFLQKHEVAHRKESTSTTCGLRLRSKRDLNGHMQFNSYVGPYSTDSSDLKNFQSLEASEETARNSLECESSSICSSQDNSIEIRDTNKTINEKDLRADVVQEEESARPSTSILNDTKSELSHLKAPLSKSTFVCDICKKSFKRKWSMGDHVRVHYDERPFSCNICDKTFKRDNSRYHHELRHMRDEIKFGKSGKGIKKNQFSCTVCRKNCSSKTALNYHSILHTDKYKCNTCGRRFRNNHHLRSHLRIHTKEKPFKCEVCLKCFSQKWNLNRHLDTHSSDKPFSCEICYMRFRSKGKMSEHKLIHLRKKWKKIRFICDICKKGFIEKQALGDHVRIHYEENSFSCNICGKLFKQDVSRCAHELKHLRDEMKFGKSENGSKKKKFSCTICSKNFSYKSGLNRHSNWHSNKYKCNSCGRCFGDNTSLRTHLNTHTKEKPFKCEVCLKCFSRKCYLDVHLGVHSSDKPFSCDICDKRFKGKGGKIQHELFHLRKE